MDNNSLSGNFMVTSIFDKQATILDRDKGYRTFNKFNDAVGFLMENCENQYFQGGHIDNLTRAGGCSVSIEKDGQLYIGVPVLRTRYILDSHDVDRWLKVDCAKNFDIPREILYDEKNPEHKYAVLETEDGRYISAKFDGHSLIRDDLHFATEKDANEYAVYGMMMGKDYAEYGRNSEFFTFHDSIYYGDLKDRQKSDLIISSMVHPFEELYDDYGNAIGKSYFEDTIPYDHIKKFFEKTDGTLDLADDRFRERIMKRQNPQRGKEEIIDYFKEIIADCNFRQDEASRRMLEDISRREKKLDEGMKQLEKDKKTVIQDRKELDDDKKRFTHVKERFDEFVMNVDRIQNGNAALKKDFDLARLLSGLNSEQMKDVWNAALDKADNLRKKNRNAESADLTQTISDENQHVLTRHRGRGR